MQRGDTFNRRHHAQHAVETAGVAHRIEMRAQNQAGQTRQRAFIATDHVADRVDVRLQSGFMHPAGYEFIGGAVLL